MLTLGTRDGGEERGLIMGSTDRSGAAGFCREKLQQRSRATGAKRTAELGIGAK